MSGKPRVGFLGAGWIGRHRMQAMLETGAVEAVGVVEPDDASAAEASALASGAERVGDLDALLALRPDGVVVATPSAGHAEQSIRCLEAGTAVFCQKPLGRSAAETRAVVEAARAADRLLAVDLSYRHAAAVRSVKDRVDAGALGRPFAADLTFHNAYGPGKPWFFDRARSGGGCVIDLGVHLVDLALWLFAPAKVVDVSARLFAKGQPLPPGAETVEDYAVATLTLDGGQVVRIACSWTLHAGQEAVIGATVYGPAGGAAFGNVGGSFYDFEAWALNGTTRERLAAPPDDWGGRAAADWARRLASGARFDPAVQDLVAVAETLDRIYAA